MGLLVLALAPGARAARDLDDEMAELAGQIEGVVKERGGAVVVGEFRGPARLASTGGPEIARSLAEQLRKRGVRVGRAADLEVVGEFRDVVDAKTRMTALRIRAKVVDRSGETVVELAPRGLFNLTTIAALTGITLATTPDAPEPRREKEIEKALDRIQPPSLANTRISARSGSPYAIEIHVGPDPGDGQPNPNQYRPRAASLDDENLAFLKIRRGEVYAVRVLNDADHDVAVTLTIDGLSMFAFSDRKDYEFVVVPKRQSGIILGWHRTNEVSDSFRVVEYARSAVAELLPSSTTIGTITASFKAAWPQDGAPPADEPAAKPGARDGDATGRGRPVDAKYDQVVRNVGRLREAVSVRYDKAGDPADLPKSKGSD